MHVLIKNRQEGKTTQLMKWVAEGVEVDKYPFWSRVAIVLNQKRHDALKREYWNKLIDFDHRVYTLHDIQHGRFVSGASTYRLDDLDAFLFEFLPGFNIDGFTITADIWEEVVECPDCEKMNNCEHEIESGSHGFGCDKCGMSGTSGASWCRQGHGKEKLKTNG